MPDIQEAKCLEFTVQILPPPPRSFWREGAKKFRFAQISPPAIYLFLYTPLRVCTKILFPTILFRFSLGPVNVKNMEKLYNVYIYVVAYFIQLLNLNILALIKSNRVKPDN